MLKSTLLAAFVAPSIALTAVGVGSSGDPRAPAIVQFSSAEASAHTTATFARADLDRSGALSADEFVSLAIVTAELSRLNGFIALSGDRAAVVSLPVKAPKALALGERARVEAVARGAFYAAAGADVLMSAGEYATEHASRFQAADRNRDGSLSGRELGFYAAREAQFARPSA